MKHRIEYTAASLAVVVLVVTTYMLIRDLPNYKNNNMNSPIVADCSRYINSMEEWIAAYDQQEKLLTQCQKDLVAAQEELNHDITCSDEQCTVR